MWCIHVKLTLTHSALQSQPHGCLDSLQANPSRPRSSARYAKRPSRVVLIFGFVEWDCEVHPCTSPFRAARSRASHSAVRIRSRRIRRTRVASATPLSPPHTQNAPFGASCVYGGESGIRTHGRFDPSPVFKTGALNRSAISPMCCSPGRVPGRRILACVGGVCPWSCACQHTGR